MRSLSFGYEMNVGMAYIIRILGHKGSEERAARCADSCAKVGMPFTLWDAYDGTGGSLVEPDHSSGSDFMRMLKLTNHYLTRSEVACVLSHVSLWRHCVQTDRPLVVLEHDAVMVRPYVSHLLYNSICYLGCSEQALGGWSVLPTPPHGSDGPNYHFILRTHAYAVDPAVAKNLCAYVLQNGICRSADTLVRADIFPIHQNGVFAHDVRDGHTTIVNRERNDRSRNDDLSS